LLYGCNVAQGEAGVRFIDRLAHYTGADVAASDDPRKIISSTKNTKSTKIFKEITNCRPSPKG